MSRRVIGRALLAPATLWHLAAVGAAVLALAGCSKDPLRRAKAEDEPEVQRYDVPTVGDRTAVGNAQPVALGGVGLVEGLEGTGGDCNHDAYRALLVEALRKDGAQQINQLFKSRTCALVIVEAQFPAGARKGDPIDIEVKLPPGSLATSLRGGQLRKCYLSDYNFANNLRPEQPNNRSMMLGLKRAVAEGPVLVDVGDGDEAARVKQGRIWAGAKCLQDYPLALLMKPDAQRASLTSLIADRVNASFQQSALAGSLDSRVAHTSDQMSVALRVPPQYRHNLERFLRVVRAVPLSEGTDVANRPEGDRRSYRQKLGDDLLDPARTVVAALRLEALGQKSIPALERGLKHDHPLVRFTSAEALTYLGKASAAEELGRAAATSPLLRAYALTALASLDEAACHLQLRQLAASNLDDETRYGAFRALRTLRENDPLVRGELLGDSFWLHRLAPNTRPFVHVATTKRAEVVLFGQAPRLVPPFGLMAGELTVTAVEGDDRCFVSRTAEGQTERKPCSLDLADVLRGLAALGGQYPEALAILQQANSCGALTCRVRVDALPQAVDIKELATVGRDAAELAGADLGATPTLYQTGLPSAGK